MTSTATVAGSWPANPRLGLRPPSGVLVAVGAGCVVLGGLVAAVTGPLGLAMGSWLAAYLVLVCGVAQYAIGRGPALLATPAMPPRSGWAVLVCWNVGNAAVIGGTLTRVPVLVDTGAALLAFGLVIAWRTARRPGATKLRTPALRVARWAYQSLLLVLLASIPVGAVLAHLRHAT